MLRNTNNNNNVSDGAATLQHLDQALTTAPGSSSSSSPCHLVGDAVSVADICVATTLLHARHHALLNNNNAAAAVAAVEVNKTVPVAVQRFLSAHQEAYDAAVAQATKLQEQAASSLQSSSVPSATDDTIIIDMEEPGLLKVVDAVFRSVVKTVFGENIVLPKNIVKACSNPKHGDFQLSAAMPIFAELKSNNSNTTSTYIGPQQVAAAIVEAIGSDHSVVTET